VWGSSWLPTSTSRWSKLAWRKPIAGNPPQDSTINRIRQLNTRRGKLAATVGASERRSYTLVGDAVNAASRIQELNKKLETNILGSESIKEAIGEEFAFKEIDIVSLKGKSQAIKIFALQ
jgi:class 3 adenylate cyclase